MKDRPTKLFEVGSWVTVATGNCGKLFFQLFQCWHWLSCCHLEIQTRLKLSEGPVTPAYKTTESLHSNGITAIRSFYLLLIIPPLSEYKLLHRGGVMC